MALIPGGLLPWIEERFLLVTASGLVPNANGYIKTFAAGTSTPLETFSDADLTTANPTTLDMDADGRLTDPVYLSPTGYKVEVYDENDVLQYTMDDVEDIGETFAATFGTLQATGSQNVTSGYTVLPGDRLVTVASSGGPNPCVINLPPADEFTGMLTIKNLGTIVLAVTPNGVQTIDSVAAAYTVDAAASPEFPSILLVSDSVSAWWILASHKV